MFFVGMMVGAVIVAVIVGMILLKALSDLANHY
jgi:hypothetical protein